MEAHGKVKSQFIDKDKKPEDDRKVWRNRRRRRSAVFTVVTAPDMVYTEETRVVDYTGGVKMLRPE